MTAPLMILAVLSAIGGFFNLPHIFSGHSSLATFMAPLFAHSAIEHAPIDEALEIKLMVVSVVAALLSAGVAYFIYVVKKSVPAADGQESGIQKVIYNKYYVDELYDTIFVKPIAALSNFFSSVIEFLVIDLLVEGVGKAVKGLSSEARLLQNGTTGYYIFAMVFSIAVILVWSLKNFILG
jgi:NADH-quinone oxidoreductase subunit L